MLRQLIKLTRPVVGLDVETHAFVPPEKSHIVEIGFKMIYPELDREPKRWVTYVKPPVPITAQATEKHHITNEMVADAPTFDQMASSLASGFTDVDFAGYNVLFDVRVLYAEMRRVKVAWTYEGARLLDSFRLWQKNATRTLSDAVEEFCGRKPTQAHRALEDAEDALDVFCAQLTRWDKMPRDVQQLHDICFRDPSRLDIEGKFTWVGQEAAINFGKHNGKLLKDVPRDYLEWMFSGDFSPEVKRILREILTTGKFPTNEVVS